jgi:hypothetical protein
VTLLLTSTNKSVRNALQYTGKREKNDPNF